MTRRIRLIMFWITLVFDIGVILFCIFRAQGLPTFARVGAPLFPWLMLGLCQIRWPRARVTTQGWVGLLILMFSFAVLAGLLAEGSMP